MPTIQEQALSLSKSEIPLSAGGYLRRREDGRIVFHDLHQREAILREVYDIWNGDWLFNIDPMPGQAYEEAIDQPGQFRLQYLRKWVKTLATTYQEEPTRRLMFQGEALEDSDPEVVALQAAYDEINLDVVLEKIDRWMYLFGNVVTRTTYNKKRDRFALHVFPAFQIRVVEDKITPECPNATILLGTTFERDAMGAAARVPTAEIWIDPNGESGTGLFRRVGQGATDWEPLATQEVPLVHFANEHQDNETGYFVRSTGIPLARLNVGLNEDYLNQLGYTMLMQAHGQMMTFGLDPKKIYEIGPGRAIDFSGDPDRREGVEYANSGADLDGIQSTIGFMVDELKSVYDIPMEDVGDNASGKSRIEAKAPTMERRMERMKLFRHPETDMARVMLDNLNTFRGLKLRGPLTGYTMVVDFATPTAAVSVTESIAQEQHDLAVNVTEPAEILMKRKPDEFDSIEAAREWIAERDAKNAERAQERADMFGLPMNEGGDESAPGDNETEETEETDDESEENKN